MDITNDKLIGVVKQPIYNVKRIERDIYEFLKKNPKQLPQIVRHYKIIKKTFANKDNILKINQRPLAENEYSKSIIVDLGKLISFNDLLNKLLNFRSVTLLYDNTIEITINESYLEEIPQILSLFNSLPIKNNNDFRSSIIENTISQINNGIASIYANIDYSNIFHTGSLDLRNEYRDELLNGLIYNNGKRWSTLEELQNYLDFEEQKANDRYNSKVIDEDFTSNETQNLNTVISTYLTKRKDHMYIRLAPFTDEEMTYEEWRDFLVKRYMQINSNDYYKMINDEYPNTLNDIIKSSELPTYNDIIAYGNKKYEKIKNLEN